MALSYNLAYQEIISGILQGVRFLLAKQIRLSGTSDNESYTTLDNIRLKKCAKKSQLGIVDEMKCVSHPGPHPTLKQMVPSVNSSRQFFS